MSIDQQLFDSVCDCAREAALLQSAADTLEWDERTRMPLAAGDYRALQVSTLRAAVHRLKTDSRYGDQLQQLCEQAADEDPHGDVAATVRLLRRDWDRDCKLPTDLVQRIAAATVRGQQTWDAARSADDYARFRDPLAEIIDLKREVGQRLADQTAKTAYEALLDEYEPDANVKQLQQVFEDVRAAGRTDCTDPRCAAAARSIDFETRFSD